MFVIRKSFRFEASHVLPHHGGKCRRLHGHSWVATLTVASDRLQTAGPEQAMVMDFERFDEAMLPLVRDFLDHWYLNDSTGLANPTSENLALWIYNKVKPKLHELTSVIIEETCTCKAEYQGEGQL